MLTSPTRFGRVTEGFIKCLNLLDERDTALGRSGKQKRLLGLANFDDLSVSLQIDFADINGNLYDFLGEPWSIQDDGSNVVNELYQACLVASDYYAANTIGYSTGSGSNGGSSISLIQKSWVSLTTTLKFKSIFSFSLTPDLSIVVSDAIFVFPTPNGSGGG